MWTHVSILVSDNRKLKVKVDELYIVGHVPDDGRVGELQHDDEADTDEDEGEVGEHHQAAHTLGVGAEGVGCGHGLHRQPRLRRVLGLDGAHPARCRHVRPHTLPAAGRGTSWSNIAPVLQ